jgi:tetratricopeptide (TPR) repeat protein
MVKSRFRVAALVLVLALVSGCAAMRHLSPGYDSYQQGLVLFNQGRFDEAVPYLEDATRQDPEFAQAYLYLGRAYVSQSRWREAIPPLRTAFRLAPRESQQEIMNLLIDAMFAAAVNNFDLGGGQHAPVRFNNTL